MDFNISLLLAGGIQGIIISIVVLKKIGNRRTRASLFALLWVVNLQIFMKAVSKGWIDDQFHLAYQCSYLMPFFVSPIVAFYAMSLDQGKKLERKDLLWLVPVALIFLQFVADFWFTGNFFFDAWWRATFQMVFLGVAIVYAYPKVKPSRWSSRFLLWTGVTQGIIILALALSVHFYLTNIWIRMMFLSLSVYLYWISYSLMTNGKNVTAKKYVNSGLKSTEASVLLETMISKMESEQLYKDPELTLDHFAEHMGVSRNHVSQALNENLGRSFKDWINEYRVREASFLLDADDTNDNTIAAIAFEAGFNSLSHFNDAFKRLKGVTPTQFRSKSRVLVNN